MVAGRKSSFLNCRYLSLIKIACIHRYLNYLLISFTAPTSVHSYPQSKLEIGFVPHFELVDRVEEVQTHVGDLGNVSVSIADG